ncbi:ATP-binding protein [Inhella gelatinilytica]|uniref:histidine kinase n=1 Tax=Inhella gelatinilytica TaxID=2795030 RepID=A0A931IYC1_9BURK|nr:ATP-binding protein [Inhella gelatinilytica]MBH9553856.1 HAMP domain-containing protein [Inhella gelatinilytica]
MRLHFRLFLQASFVVLVTAAALLLIGGHELRKLEIEQLEERLCMEARRLGNPRRSTEPEARLFDDILRKLRLDSPDQLRMHWQDGAAVAKGQPDKSPETAWFGIQAQLKWDPAVGRDAPGSGRTDPRGRCETAEVQSTSAEWAVVRIETRAGTGYLAAQLTSLDDELKALWQRTLQVMLPLAVLLAAVSAAGLAITMMRPVQRLREAMRCLTPQELSRRLTATGEPSEFRELIAAYNDMAERLEASFHQASRFSADAAHELRTPLTILQGRLERAIEATYGRAVQAELGAILEEVTRLTGISRKLLLLSRADAGRLDLHREPVNLSALLDNLVADAHMLSDERQLDVKVPPGLVVSADAVLLRQLLNNLLSNSLRHGLTQGALQIHARDLATGVEVTFSNATSPLTPAQRARFFERFYRSDAAHSRQVDGTGLGLSLAREIARAHGGSLSLLDTSNDRVTMQLILPR